MSPLRLDHLVYAVPELVAGVDALEKRLGVRASPGGKHVGLGTHNALISLGEDQYLELIGPDPDQPQPARPRPFGIDELGADGRLAAWAAKERDLEARVAAARKAGYDPGPVLDLSRDTPDGKRLEWRLTMRQTLGGDGLVPFLIDWRETPSPARSASQGCTLVTLRGEHPDTATVREELAAIDADLPLTQAPHVSLVAAIETPLGRVELR